MRTFSRFLLLMLGLSLTSCVLADLANPTAPADFSVTTTVQRPSDKVPPLGAGGWGEQGAVNYAANNWFHGSGNEPVYFRNLWRVTKSGPHWFEIDGPGTDWWGLYASGFLSGATVRIYRLVDKDGQTLPLNKNGDYLDTSKADHVKNVGVTQILPEGAPGFPDGGWVANSYQTVYPIDITRDGNTQATDCYGIENGHTYWYTVKALAGNAASKNANEASAMPLATAQNSPHIVISVTDSFVNRDPFANSDVNFVPAVMDGQAPYRWSLLDAQHAAWMLPDGMKFDPLTGHIYGKYNKAALPAASFILQVTDAAGKSDGRSYTINAPPEKTGAVPDPPTEVSAVAGNGCITITWKPSPSPNVTGYRILRSTAPAAQQESRG